jgi:uncharacterized linocin/CFP29 family protein
MVEEKSALQRAATYFDMEIVAPLRAKAMARKLDILRVIDMGEAQIAYALPKDMSRDMIKITRESVNIPFLFKGYEVDRDDIAAWANQGIGLDSAAAISAAHAIAVMEDSAIIQGWIPDGAAYQMPGLFQAGEVGGEHYVTVKDFKTFGDATEAVSALMAQLELVYVYPPFNLVLNPTEHAGLVASSSSTGTREYPTVLEILNGNLGMNGPGKIFSSPNIVAGKGMMLPVDTARVYFELLNPQPVRNVLGEDSKMPGISDITGTAYEALYVHVKQPKSIGIFDDINGAT